MAGPAGTYLSVRTSADPYSVAGEDLLAALRAVPPPAPVQFGGNTAINQDSMRAMGDRLPLAGAVIVLTSLMVLFFFTGSVVLPLKALLLNVLSLTASFGALAWVFQYGHFAAALGFTATGKSQPGDADPHVLPSLRHVHGLRSVSAGPDSGGVARVRSHTRGEYSRSGDGIATTARIYTAAAGLMALVIGAMATSQVSFMVMFGIGLSLAVIVDAFVIRTALAPALMQLMSTFNWWAPKPLTRPRGACGSQEEDSHGRHRLAQATSANYPNRRAIRCPPSQY